MYVYVNVYMYVNANVYVYVSNKYLNPLSTQE